MNNPAACLKRGDVFRKRDTCQAMSDERIRRIPGGMVMGARRLKIVLVEDHCLFREVLAKVCREMDLEVAGETDSGEGAIALIGQTEPDLVLLDLQLNGDDGFSVLERAGTCRRLPRFLVLSAHADAMIIYRLEKAGINGFLGKTCDVVELKTALAAVVEGRTYYARSFLQARERRLQDPASFDKVLSRREQEILALIGLALTDDEIAQRMGIASATAATHRKHLLAKLGFTTTAKLIGYAHAHGFTKMIPTPRGKLKQTGRFGSGTASRKGFLPFKG